MSTKFTLAVCALALASTSALHADTFGSDTNTFTIEFVSVGNAGNTDDAGAGGGLYFTPYGGVAYNYRVGTYELSQDAITKATALGLTNVVAGAWGASQPAANVTWYEAAAFVNWLNTSTGHQAAYNLDAGLTALTPWSSAQAWQLGGENLFRHKDAYYFLPTEDEWYKAAYHKNDGATANYWDYPTSSNSIPDGLDFSGDPAFDAVFNQGFNPNQPNAVTNVGIASAYGTFGQGGNVWEWMESNFSGDNSSDGTRATRGSDWSFNEDILRSSLRNNATTTAAANFNGFRVASVPEPTVTVSLILASGVLLARRKRLSTR